MDQTFQKWRDLVRTFKARPNACDSIDAAMRQIACMAEAPIVRVLIHAGE